jgi:hypothetical protein
VNNNINTMKHIIKFNTFKNESLIIESMNLNIFFEQQKIIKDIQDIAYEFVNEHFDENTITRDLKDKKNNLIFWVAKSFKKELIDTIKDDEFLKYINGGVFKQIERYRKEIKDIFNNNYREKYYEIFDYFLSPVRTNKLNIVTSSFKEMYVEQLKWHENLKEIDISFIDESGVIIKTFPDGFYWIDLQTKVSKQEASAMGHCGKTSADTMLSLRDSAKKPHITMAVDYLNKDELTYKSIRQCKGKGNKKPIPRYHSYIVELLLDEKFDNVVISNNEYNAVNDFHTYDLEDEKLLAKLLSNKPNLFEHVPLVAFKNNNINIILEAFPQILESPNIIDYFTLINLGYIKKGDTKGHIFEYFNDITYYLCTQTLSFYTVNLKKLEDFLDKKLNLNLLNDINHVKRYILDKLYIYNLDIKFVNSIFNKHKEFFSVDVISDSECVFLYKNGKLDKKVLDRISILEYERDFYRISDISSIVTIVKIEILSISYGWDTIEEIDELDEDLLKKITSHFPELLDTEDVYDSEIYYNLGLITKERLEEIEKNRDEYIDENPKIYAFFLKIVKDENGIDQEYELYNIEENSSYDSYSHPNVSGEYYVLTDEEADERYKDMISSEVDVYSTYGDIINNIITDDIMDMIKDFYDDVIREEPSNYDVEKTFTGQEVLDTLNDELDILNDELSGLDEDDEDEDIQDRISEINDRISEIEEEIEEIEDESNDSYWIYDEDSIEAAIESHTNSYSGSEISWLKELYGDGDELISFIKRNNLYDEEGVIEDIFNSNNREQFLATYDGYEYDISTNNETYYIYRHN